MKKKQKAARAATPATAYTIKHLRSDFTPVKTQNQGCFCVLCGTRLYRGESRYCGPCAMWRAVRLNIAAAARRLEVLS